MASPTQLLPPPAKDFNDAKHLYMEQFGSAVVTNMYLRVAVLCLSLLLRSMEYKPQAPEIKYFLTQFVHDYYSRNRATVRDDFARALFFLDSRLASARMEQNRKTKELENFIVGANEEIEVNVQNIVLQDLRTPPFRATVDFEKRYLSGRDRTEIRREKYVASFQFLFKDNVSNNMIPVNPLGLTITYFRDDQSFQRSSRDCQLRLRRLHSRARVRAST